MNRNGKIIIAGLLLLAIIIPVAMSISEQNNLIPNIKNGVSTITINKNPAANPTNAGAISDSSISTIPYNAVYTKTDPNTYRVDNNTWKEVSNYTFYLPVGSNVYIEVDGFFANYKGSAQMDIGIDNNFHDSGDSTFVGSQCYYCWLRLYTSKGYYLLPGNHIIHVSAANAWGDNQMATIGDIHITAIASQKGSVT